MHCFSCWLVGRGTAGAVMQASSLSEVLAGPSSRCPAAAGHRVGALHILLRPGTAQPRAVRRAAPAGTGGRGCAVGLSCRRCSGAENTLFYSLAEDVDREKHE